MSIRENIQKDLKESMKSGDNEKRDVLRMLDSMFKNVEIEKNKREEGLDNDEIIEIIIKAVKQRKDSMQQFTDGGREDLAKKEKMEIDILDKYLPEQMSESELRIVVNNAIEEISSNDKSDLGKIMGKIMGKIKGKADGNMVRKTVEDVLNSQN